MASFPKGTEATIWASSSLTPIIPWLLNHSGTYMNIPANPWCAGVRRCALAASLGDNRWTDMRVVWSPEPQQRWSFRQSYGQTLFAVKDVKARHLWQCNLIYPVLIVISYIYIYIKWIQFNTFSYYMILYQMSQFYRSCMERYSDSSIISVLRPLPVTWNSCKKPI